MEDEPQTPKEWRCTFDMSYPDLCLLRDCVDLYYQRWPGGCADEQEQLIYIRSQLDQAKLDYIFKFK